MPPVGSNIPLSTIVLAGVFLCVLPLLLGTILALRLSRGLRDSRATTDAWGELAKRTGLEAGRYKVAGTYRAHQVKFYNTSYRGITYLHLEVTVDNQTAVFLKLSQQSNAGLDKMVASTLHEDDLQIGDHDFDDRFIIESHPAGFAQTAFSSVDMRRRLLEAPAGFWIELNQKILKWTFPGIVGEVDRLELALDLMSHIAETLDAFTK
jgi:hypothetical protein